MTNRHGRRRRQKRHKARNGLSNAWMRARLRHGIGYDDLFLTRLSVVVGSMDVHGTHPDFPGIDLFLDARVPDGPFGYGPRA